MKHSIEAGGESPITLRERRRDLRTEARAQVLESNDKVSTSRFEAFKLSPTNDSLLWVQPRPSGGNTCSLMSPPMMPRSTVILTRSAPG
jgi:hypothetical protein